MHFEVAIGILRWTLNPFIQTKILSALQICPYFYCKTRIDTFKADFLRGGKFIKGIFFSISHQSVNQLWSCQILVCNRKNGHICKVNKILVWIKAFNVHLESLYLLQNAFMLASPVFLLSLYINQFIHFILFGSL